MVVTSGDAPIDVHCCVEVRLFAAVFSTRNEPVYWSAIDSPRPVPMTLFDRFNVHELSKPEKLPELSLDDTINFQLPLEA